MPPSSQMSAKPPRKFCRVCLKEIRTNVTRNHSLLEQPSPMVQLRDGRKANSYLECYYYCLGSSNAAAITHTQQDDSLVEYGYICVRCKYQLVRSIEFQEKLQKNEEFLKSMYDKSTYDSITTTTTEAVVKDNDDDLFSTFCKASPVAVHNRTRDEEDEVRD